MNALTRYRLPTMTYPDADKLKRRCEDAMETDRIALQAAILRRQRNEKWTTANVFFWFFALAVGIAILALFCNR